MVKVRGMPGIEKIINLGSSNIIPFTYSFISVRKEKVHTLFCFILDIMCFILYHFSYVFVPNAIGLLWLNCIQKYLCLPSFINHFFPSHSS